MLQSTRARKDIKCRRSNKLHKCFEAVKIFICEVCKKKKLHEAALPQKSPQAQVTSNRHCTQHRLHNSVSEFILQR